MGVVVVVDIVVIVVVVVFYYIILYTDHLILTLERNKFHIKNYVIQRPIYY